MQVKAFLADPSAFVVEAAPEAAATGGGAEEKKEEKKEEEEEEEEEEVRSRHLSLLCALNCLQVSKVYLSMCRLLTGWLLVAGHGLLPLRLRR